MHKLTYRHTQYASYLGYVTQAIVNNLAPLLFIAFQNGFGLSRLQITSIITINFLLQLGVDLAAAGFIDRIGYRAAAVLSMVTASAGLVCMGMLPFVLPDAYTGLLIAVFLPLGVLDYVQIGAGALSIILVMVVLPAYRNAVREPKERLLLGKSVPRLHGTDLRLQGNQSCLYRYKN